MIVVDLDGTLITVNSFKLWVKFLLKMAVVEGHLTLLIKLLWLIFLRKILGLSHGYFKSQICRIDISLNWTEIFITHMMAFLNHTLINELMNKQFIVATAAPACYAKLLVENIFSKPVDTFASKWNGHYFINNTAEVKLNSLLEFYGPRFSRVYSDSKDDLPLMKVADEVVLVEAYMPLHMCDFKGVNIIRVQELKIKNK